MQQLYKATFRTDGTHRSVGNVMSHERLFLLSFLPVNFSSFYIQVMSLNLTLSWFIYPPFIAKTTQMFKYFMFKKSRLQEAHCFIKNHLCLGQYKYVSYLIKCKMGWKIHWCLCNGSLTEFFCFRFTQYLSSHHNDKYCLFVCRKKDRQTKANGTTRTNQNCFRSG